MAETANKSDKGGAPTPTGGLGEFVHLHLHTEYSLLDGGNRIDKLVARVAELGMKAVGVTDHGNIFGAVAVYQACKDKGIKPILGVEAYVTPPGKPRTDRTYSGGGEGGFHLVLLAQTNDGWQNLLVLCSEAYLSGFYYKPRIDRELLEKHSAGLVAINGHLGSEIGDHLLAYQRGGDQKHWDLAVESARWHDAVFNREWRAAGGKRGVECGVTPRFYVELQHHIPEQNAINPLLIRLAKQLDLPLVCDNDSHFLRAEDHDSHDTLICISTGKGKNDQNRMRYPQELYVKSPAEMREVFAEYGEIGREAMANTVRIAESCSVELPLGRNNAPMVRVRVKEPLPSHDDAAYGGDISAWYRAYCEGFEVVPFKLDDGLDEGQRRAMLEQAKAECDRALRLLAGAGFVWRYGVMNDSAGAEFRARLERELKILCDKNISAYFLIVWDFVNWGREHGVPALARGSGVGTMVGYVLGLSNACPVRYGLLFERFTDPDRSEYPDIDIDLCQDGRQAVINYVRNKYGHVAQIITFGTMKAKAAIRDVGRVLEMPLPDVDRIAKLIPEALGTTLDDALEGEPELKKLYERDAAVTRLIDNAKALEGHTRHAGVHAAGVIVATRPLHDIVPLYRQPGSEGNETITQWDGPTCEKMGLLKMDFLGLRTISIIERAKRLIRETLSEEEIWRAVGRGEEFKKWHSGRVAKWQSEGQPEPRREDQDLSRPDRVATGNGLGAAGVQRNTGDAQARDLRAHEPDAESRDVNPDEHRGGLRSAHTTGVRARTPARGGVPVRTDDGVRDRNEHRNDQEQRSGARTPRGTGPADSGANPYTSGEGQAVQDGMTTLPLGHSATLPLLTSHPLDLDRISCEDPKVFELFQRGETTGIFQFESGGMRRLLVEMKPDRLEDLIAANALFRPGPMDLIPDYNKRKHGIEEVPRVHDIVDMYTRETYGVMVYQEQVMQIVHGLGGIKLRDAYTLIKNISKKKHDKIEKERPKFVDGAQKQGLSRQQAEDLFELILKFAGYGFNKSHSTGYAIVAYQTAYLKTYFPNQYMAAFLTFESGANKVSDWIPYLEDCRRTRFIDAQTGRQVKVGVEVRPPELNLSRADFAVVFDEGEPHDALHGHVRFGLKAIKGAGDKAIEAIIAEREKSGPFTSLFDFCERMPPGSVNKATIESLVKCGAFDRVHGRDARAAMVATIDQAIAAGQKLAQDKAAGQGALFGFGGGPATPEKTPVTLAKSPPWNETETLAQEKSVLGFYVSSHPLDRWKHWSQTFATATTAGVKECKQDARVIVAAMVQSVRTIVTRNGKAAGQKMAILTVEDLSGACDCVMFTDCYGKYGHLAEAEAVVFVLGRVDLKRGDPQILVDRLVPIDGVPLEGGRVRLFVDEVKLNGSGAPALTRIADLIKGEGAKKEGAALFPVEIVIGTAEQVAVLSCDAKMRLNLGPDLVKAIEGEIGAGMVRVVGGVALDKTEPKEKKKWERRGGSDE